VRSPLRHPKLRRNRASRVFRQNKAFFDALARGWLPGELVPFITRSGEVMWLDFGAPSPGDIATARRLQEHLRPQLKARGLL
jgi:hypothetical protein